eukprot:TRINITY_DN69211_c0_g1_i1.p1 TRINITY_DN69211_c0_g1~~TRINITY_DN69211_c0_g1_i1.p1  ORF type:complete len:481 (-),score=72.99 TRINITY_DN69211_c0_g1_i1:116-1513(-)
MAAESVAGGIPNRLDAELERRILASVRENMEAQVEFIKELIRFPSLRGKERGAQEFMTAAFRKRGFDIDQWSIDEAAIKEHPGFSPGTFDYDGAVNVVGTYHPERCAPSAGGKYSLQPSKGKSLILNGHIDVVPTGPEEMWAKPPFEPHVEGDWLYGRGAGDMKAGVAANVFALDALRRIGLEPASTVHVQSVCEEECTGNGALAALVRGYIADAVIIPEPMNECLIRANVGVIWCQVKVAGRPVHVMQASTGANAIDAAIYLIGELKKFEAARNELKCQHARFADLEKPINLNIGKIVGGDWASSVPAWCNFDIRTGLYPGEDAREGARALEAFILEAASKHPFLSEQPPQLVFNGFMAEGYELPEGSAAETTLRVAHERVFRAEMESKPTLAYLDARVFALYGSMPALVYGPYSDNIHGFDERVSIASIERVTATIALFVAMWCGVRSVGGDRGDSVDQPSKL